MTYTHVFRAPRKNPSSRICMAPVPKFPVSSRVFHPVQALCSWMAPASSTSTKKEEHHFLATMLAALEASTATHVDSYDFFPSIMFDVTLSILFWLHLGDKSFPTLFFVRCHTPTCQKCFQQLWHCVVRIQRGGIWRCDVREEQFLHVFEDLSFATPESGHLRNRATLADKFPPTTVNYGSN